MPDRTDVDAREKSRLTKEEWREYTKTVWHIANTSHPNHPAVFPAEIPHRLVKLFTFYGETVLDPFAGTGSTAKAAIPLGRKAICVDQNKDYVDIITAECGSLRNGVSNTGMLTAVNADSRDLKFIKDDSVSLVVTSPPYWNKADYGENEANLGTIGQYGTSLTQFARFFNNVRGSYSRAANCVGHGERKPAHRPRTTDIPLGNRLCGTAP